MTPFETRRRRAMDLMKSSGLDAVVFVPGVTFEYLTDVSLHLLERLTLFGLTHDGGQVAVMPALEQIKWADRMPEAETFYWADADGPEQALGAFSDAIGGSMRIGVEGLRMRAAEFLALQAHWSSDQIVDADDALVDLRMFKDAGEIADLKRAISISEAALGEVLNSGVKGQTERELETRLRAAALAHGAEGFSFDPIVLTGGNAANPHGSAGDTVVQAGDCLLIDFGASYGAMHADITRTVFCDHAADADKELYETVLAANRAGVDYVAPGKPVGGIDHAANSVLRASPFSDLIMHRTGHGLGREVHEAPNIIEANDRALETGMVFTVEPGLYRRNQIGVRIEDDVLVTETGAECLTQFARELTIVA